ncbi:restriction endonuclease subunit S [Atopobium fossor]|uniref:restriction endonuclease subunit S n=1 Tax=Atopobium fossor TaxID=39487 RepID=UPI0003F623D1|nr:restriction endonuclease subunit S [Atopobium fossor]
MGSKYKIGELCNFFRGASVPRARMQESGDYLYVHYGDLYKGFNIYIDVEDPQKPLPAIASSEKIKGEQFLVDQDIVYVLTSETVNDLGHAFLFKDPTSVPAVAGTETTIMRVSRQDLVLPAYLNYMTQTVRFKRLLRQYVKGMKVFRVHPSDVARIEIDLPSLEDQHKAVHILDNIESKITLNQRTNDNLAA